MGELGSYSGEQMPLQGFLEGHDTRDIIKEDPLLNITLEDIAEIELDLTSENLVYKGEGATSSASKYDKDKANWLRGIGVEVPEYESSNGILTAFNIARNLIVLKAIYEDNISSRKPNAEYLTRKALFGVNSRLHGNRIDRVGNRDIVTEDGESYEEIASKFSFNSNPEKKVSVEEYNALLELTLDSLKRKK